MTISELISILEEIKHNTGDCDVEARSHGCCPNSHYIREVILDEHDVVVIEV